MQVKLCREVPPQRHQVTGSSHDLHYSHKATKVTKSKEEEERYHLFANYLFVLLRCQPYNAEAKYFNDSTSVNMTFRLRYTPVQQQQCHQ